MNLKKLSMIASVIMLAMMMGACSSNKGIAHDSSKKLEKEYAEKLERLKQKEAQLAKREVEASRQQRVSHQNPISPGGSLLPPKAKPGECYARVWVPPKFKNVTERVVAREEDERLEVIPAKYQWGSERVVVREASSKLIPVQPTYKNISERVLVQDEETFWTFGTSGVQSAKGANAKKADANRLNIAKTSGIPDNVAIGQCYAEYYRPDSYTTQTERVLKNAASKKVQIIPASYENVTERVMVSEASEKVETVPATYKTVTEKVLVKPGYTTWRVSECSGGQCVDNTGQIVNRVTGVKERIDQATGEVMCLVQIPDQYKTVSKRVMVTPPSTRTINIPAKYETVTKRVMKTPPQEKVIEIPASYQTVTKRVKATDSETFWCQVGGNAGQCTSGKGGRPTGDVFCLNSTPAKYKTITKRIEATPASTKRMEIPAQYKTVKVRKLVTPASERRVKIPAKYQTVTRREQISEGHMEWQSVLCAANMTRAKIMEVQRALKKQGFYRGPIDGVVGSMTTNAIQAFQKSKGLVVSQYLTTQSVEALGVNPG